MSDQIIVTSEGLKKLETELLDLKNNKRKEVAERLKEAISYGDLSENSEYQQAKEEQAFIEGRIIELSQQIKNAKVVDDKAAKKGKNVRIGSTVTLINGETKKQEQYYIVGSTEADPFTSKISNESPIGKAIIGKKKGDTVNVEAPVGIIQYEIIDMQ